MDIRIVCFVKQHTSLILIEFSTYISCANSSKQMLSSICAERNEKWLFFAVHKFQLGTFSKLLMSAIASTHFASMVSTISVPVLVKQCFKGTLGPILSSNSAYVLWSFIVSRQTTGNCFSFESSYVHFH